MYNVPGRTGCNILPETAAKIFKEVENVVAIKEATGSVAQASQLMYLTDGRIDLYSGEDGIVVPVSYTHLAEKGSQAVYQYVEMGHHCEEHLHLKCVSCGCIIHLECAFMDEIAEHVLKDHGFTLQCKNSIIYGLCRECRKKQDRE